MGGSIARKAKMKCGICGKKITWFNDVPLTGFCWGTEKKPHEDWSEIVPRPFNPYLEPNMKEEK